MRTTEEIRSSVKTAQEVADYNRDCLSVESTHDLILTTNGPVSPERDVSPQRDMRGQTDIPLGECLITVSRHTESQYHGWQVLVQHLESKKGWLAQAEGPGGEKIIDERLHGREHKALKAIVKRIDRTRRLKSC